MSVQGCTLMSATPRSANDPSCSHQREPPAPCVIGSWLYEVKPAQDLCLQIPKYSHSCLFPSSSLPITNTSPGPVRWQSPQASGGAREMPDIWR